MAFEYFNNVDGLADILCEMKERTFAPTDALTIGEYDHMGPEDVEDVIGENGSFSSVFDFCHTLDNVRNPKWGNTVALFDDYRDQLFAAQKIDAHVLRQPEQPGGKGRVELILLQRPPELQKYLLRQIQRVVGIARHAVADVVDRLLVQQHELLKGAFVLRRGSADQDIVLQWFHLKSLCIPLAIDSISSMEEIEEIFSL